MSERMRRLSLLLGGLSLALLALPALALDPATGTAKARDGWTIAIGGVRVRLAGLTEPAADRACGARTCAEAAAARLGEAVDGRSITCSRERRLGHGFYLGRCTLADGADPALLLIEQGLAKAEPDAPEAYRAAAEEAKQAGLGMFGS